VKRSRAYATLLLAVALLLFAGAAASIAVTQKDLQESRERADQAREAAEKADKLAEQLRKETEALDKQIADLESNVLELNPQIEEASARTRRLRSEVNRLRGEIAGKEEQIAETTAEYERQSSLLNDRMTVSYKQGSLYYLDLLLSAKDFSDFITRTTLVQRVIKSNQDIANNLADTKTDLEAARVELDRSLEAVSIKRAEAEALEKQLLDMQAERQGAMDAQVSVQNQKASLMEQTERNAERLRAIAAQEEEESRRIEEELQKQSSNGSGQFNGIMEWPTPGFYRVTSSFGWRIHPIFGTKKLHTGIDIGRNLDPEQSINGASIVAAGDGTVIYAGYRSGYGNTVMVDHGEGVVTLYAHQQSGGIKVANGQGVSKGERVGTVGSTGYSTGPHLHFEVRTNGTPVDPMKYLK